jgi:hypothetical protein
VTDYPEPRTLQAGSEGVPERFLIEPDDYHARLVGTAQDGRRFFITTPFEPDNEFVALFLWGADGSFDSIDVDGLGRRELLSDSDLQDALERRIARLGEFRIEPISVAPFAVESHGTTFGFVPQEFDGSVSIDLLPGNYMSYVEPWDSGEYDT